MKKSIQKSIVIAITAVLFQISGELKAQFDYMFTQYMFNETFINPAYAGSKEAMSATLLHRQQWVNFSGRPVTTSFAIHGPLMENKMGLGLSVLNERIGVLNHNLIYLNYAYRLKTGEKSTLAFGLMGGLHNQVNKFDQIKSNDDGSKDPQFIGTPSTMAPNFGTGIYFNNQSFYAGLSVPRFIDDRVKFSTNGSVVVDSKVQPEYFHYYLTVGNLFKLNKDLKLKAQGMLKAVQNSPLQFDLNANLLIKDMVWAGLGYRNGSAASAMVGLQVNAQFLVSYAFDYTLNDIQKYSQGSHEIVLNYLFSYKGKKVITPRYF
ncbi:MAG: type IX secretion system membrane protein PorP/SprF [Sphingobacteriaceae bacterium]|nr:type IX secretion system membrane protein PorP/SprF [Sphingobacteriaceae bacterium]